MLGVQLQHLCLLLVYCLAVVVSKVHETNAGGRLHVNAPPESRPSSASPQVDHAAAARLRLGGLEPSPAEEHVSEETPGPQLERGGEGGGVTGSKRKHQGEETGGSPTWMVMGASGYLR